MEKKKKTRRIKIVIFLICCFLLFATGHIFFGTFVAVIGLFCIVVFQPTAPTKQVRDWFQALNILPNRYVVLDTETTGLDPASCEIIEIGAIRYESGREIDSFHRFVRPSAKIPANITKLTGITTKDVKDAPLPDEVAQEFSRYLQDDVIVGYNVGFDVKFVQTRFDLEFSNGAYDVLKLARKYIHDTKNHKLATLKEYLGIGGGSHNALDDCRTTQAVILHCQRKAAEEEEERQRVAAEKKRIKEIKQKAIKAVKDSPDGIKRTDLIALFDEADKAHVVEAIDNVVEAGAFRKEKIKGRIVFFP